MKNVQILLPDFECGNPHVGLDAASYIVNGMEAYPGAWPWQVAIFVSGVFSCGASIIADHWLLTAAHCIV